MRKLIFQLTAVVLTICLHSISSHAQSKEEIKYRQTSEKIRSEIWAWDIPQFNVTAVPEKYNKASRVVIAHHAELTAENKSKADFNRFFLSTNNELTITEVVRERIKLNDKAAVEEYSELGFTKFERKSGFRGNSRTTTFVGVRVVKPGNIIKQVDADEIVLTKDEALKKEARLAIPNLEPGDIIDYFIATRLQLKNDYDVRSYSLLLYDEMPIMHYSFHGELGKKYSVEYRSYNGAPELSVVKNSNREVIMDVVKEDIEPYESWLWLAPLRQLPMIRMNIALGYGGFHPGRWNTSKPGKVVKDITTDEVVTSFSKIQSRRFVERYMYTSHEWDEIVKDAKKKAKLLGLDYKKMSVDDQVAHLFYVNRFRNALYFEGSTIDNAVNRGGRRFDGGSFELNCMLQAADIDVGLLVAPPRTGYKMDEVLEEDDLRSLAFVTESKKILHLGTIFDYPFEVPEYMEGIADARVVKFKTRVSLFVADKFSKFATVGPGFALPVSKAPTNSRLEQMSIIVNPHDSKLSVQRKTTVKGHYKYDLQKRLILYEDYYESERKLLGEETTLWQIAERNKETADYVGEVKNAFNEARRVQKDAFIEEAESWFEQDVTDMANYKVENMGVRHTSPDFVYSAEFSLDGLVKKAGNNLILEIGKIQGEPLSIRDNQRQRTLDVYMPFPRSIGYDIRIKIPDGYSVEGIDALKKTVENETGYFKTDASISGQTLTVTIKKSYLHNFEPAANWDKMLSFIDASNEFTNAKLLLKKN